MGQSPNPKSGWDTGLPVPGAFKLAHLQPIKPILLQLFDLHTRRPILFFLLAIFLWFLASSVYRIGRRRRWLLPPSYRLRQRMMIGVGRSRSGVSGLQDSQRRWFPFAFFGRVNEHKRKKKKGRKGKGTERRRRQRDWTWPMWSRELEVKRMLLGVYRENFPFSKWVDGKYNIIRWRLACIFSYL